MYDISVSSYVGFLHIKMLRYAYWIHSCHESNKHIEGVVIFQVSKRVFSTFGDFGITRKLT